MTQIYLDFWNQNKQMNINIIKKKFSTSATTNKNKSIVDDNNNKEL